MWSCPQTAASVVVPSKTELCVIFLVEHTDVSVSSLPVDTMELKFKIVCGLVRNATSFVKPNKTELYVLSLFVSNECLSVFFVRGQRKEV